MQSQSTYRASARRVAGFDLREWRAPERLWHAYEFSYLLVGVWLWEEGFAAGLSVASPAAVAASPLLLSADEAGVALACAGDAG